MSEDVSATMRVGITVILVAALVATVLNLMVMSNSILSNGQTTLQSGIDSVSEQEFAPYNNTKVSGTQVSTALSLFQGRDVAILIETGALRKVLGGGKTMNYGALVTNDGKPSDATNMPVKITTTTGDGSTLISQTCKSAYLVPYKDAGFTTTANPAVVQNDGEPYYTAYLHNTNGLIDTNYDVVNTTTLGNSAYLLSSARFTSVLIKDPTGSIIGIFFKQVN